MAKRFALASSSVSTITIFDADGKITGVRNFPPNVGELVHSGGDRFFFIRSTPVNSRGVRVKLITWNPFTDTVKTDIRPVPFISGFIWLVRVDTLPEGAYTFTVVGSSARSGQMMIEHYSSIQNSWRDVHCDDCVVQDVFDLGAAPPLPVFRQFYLDGRVGPPVKFACPGFYITTGWRSRPLPHAPRPVPFAALDDLYRYVLLRPGSRLDMFVLQGVYHPDVNTHEVLFTSPEFVQYNSIRHETFVIGAKTAALVVQIPRLPGESNADVSIMGLYVFEKKRWQYVPIPGQFTRDDFERALLCETTLTLRDAASKRKFQEVDEEEASSN